MRGLKYRLLNYTGRTDGQTDKQITDKIKYGFILKSFPKKVISFDLAPQLTSGLRCTVTTHLMKHCLIEKGTHAIGI